MPRTSLRSPIPYLGGKGLLVKRLLPLFPPHQRYVEVFGGGASVLLAKPPSPFEVYNDIDRVVVTFWRVLRDPELFQEFVVRASLTPYSREEYRECKRSLREPADPVTVAWRFFVVARMGFSGIACQAAGWSHSVTAGARGMAAAVSKYLSAVDGLEAIHRRLRTVQIECQDFRDILSRYDGEDVFFYLDPPYHPSVRGAAGYHHDTTEEDHRDLVDILLSLKGKALLSGYANEEYERLERAGWRRIDWRTSSFAVGRTRRLGVIGKGSASHLAARVESVWFNYAPEGKE